MRLDCQEPPQTVHLFVQETGIPQRVVKTNGSPSSAGRSLCHRELCRRADSRWLPPSWLARRSPTFDLFGAMSGLRTGARALCDRRAPRLSLKASESRTVMSSGRPVRRRSDRGRRGHGGIPARMRTRGLRRESPRAIGPLSRRWAPTRAPVAANRPYPRREP